MLCSVVIITLNRVAVLVFNYMHEWFATNICAIYTYFDTHIGSPIAVGFKYVYMCA